MNKPSINKYGLEIVALTLGLLLMMMPMARAEDTVTLSISLKDHRFQPAELHAPAGKPITIILKNLDPVPAEFELSLIHI